MAIRYFCDGCDTEVPQFRTTLTVSVESESDYVSTDRISLSDTFHLCSACVRKYRDQMNPKKWVRAKKEIHP